MTGLDSACAVEVGDCARDFEDAIVRARGEAQFLDGVLQKFFSFGGNFAMLAKQFGRHLRIRVDFSFAFEAFELKSAGGDDAFANRGGGFDCTRIAQIFVFYGGDFDVNVDAVEQRAGNFGDVALNLRRRAVAVARGIAKESAGARIHRSGEHESRRKTDGKSSASNGDHAVFERLAENFEDVALKFRELIEKKHAIVAQGNFPRTGNCAAADQTGIADGVVRRAVRTRADEAARIIEDAGDAVNARGFDGLIKRHWWKNCGDTFGEHRFAGAGRPDEQNVVSAGTGDFESALGGLLSAYVAQIHRIGAGSTEQFLRVDEGRREGLRGIYEIGGLRERFDGENVDAFDHGGFASVGLRDNYIPDSPVACGDCSGESATDGAHGSIERKFAKKNIIAEGFAEKCS